ncbi:MAG: hypothetical protein NW218_20140 [Saprospiraceae bacterium]|nr:hypothetical protein [Saprospiraceae bacterium]
MMSIHSILILFSLLSMTTLRAQNTQIPKPLLPAIDQTGEKWVTITKVKRPWYAFRGVVVKKFIQSMPEYAAIPLRFG